MSNVSLDNSPQNTENLLSGIGSWCFSSASAATPTGFPRCSLQTSLLLADLAAPCRPRRSLQASPLPPDLAAPSRPRCSLQTSLLLADLAAPCRPRCSLHTSLLLPDLAAPSRPCCRFQPPAYMDSLPPTRLYQQECDARQQGCEAQWNGEREEREEEKEYEESESHYCSGCNQSRNISLFGRFRTCELCCSINKKSLSRKRKREKEEEKENVHLAPIERREGHLHTWVKLRSEEAVK